MNLLFWAPLSAASLHIIEEFVYPGSFMRWYRRARPGISRSITPRFLWIVNLLLLILCYDVGALAGRPGGVWLWLVVGGVLGANGVWHLVYSIRTRSYSPGVATGVMLYVPMALYGLIHFVATRQISLLPAALAFAAGCSYQFWANMLHRRRTGEGT